MLEPDGRAALTEQLRPPSGFQLSYAVATTFTLDLTTALSVPLSFAAHRVRESRDPIAILDAVRRAADRIDIFAQAGQIFEPSVNSALFALLEPMIHPVQAPRPNMLFHPKVWVLEYADDDARSYRMLCASRNLTNDRSWDLVVRLDGVPSPNPSRQSEPLVEFVRTLPSMCVQPLPTERAARVEALAEAISSVEWELPNDVRSLRFHPFGIPGIVRQPLPELFEGLNHGIVSPFLSDDGIGRIVPPGSSPITVLSRREQLDRLDTSTLKRVQALILDDAAYDDEMLEEEHSQGSSPSDPRPEPFVGLHAKAYVVDRRSASHLFVGSANATESAFGGNVEMLVEFEGPRPKLGVEALLGEESPLRALTVRFDPVGNVEQPADEAADYALEQSLRLLAASRYLADVVLIENLSPADLQQQYGIRLSGMDATAVPAEITATATLLTRPANAAPVPGEPVLFDRLTLTDITPFMVIRVTDQRGATASTVITAELRGDIAGRHDAVVAGQLADRSAFLKLLALLLAIEGGEGVFFFESLSAGAAGGWAEDGSGLFETLVKAIGVEHHGLADVRRIVEHLREADSGRPEGAASVLPEGFDELWESVWAVYSPSTQDAAP